MRKETKLAKPAALPVNAILAPNALLKPKQAMRALHYKSRKSLYNAEQRGTLTPVRVSKELLLYPRHQIEAILSGTA